MLVSLRKNGPTSLFKEVRGFKEREARFKTSKVGGLTGPLPSALRKASGLKLVACANQQIEGAIPSFTSTLSLVALYRNRLKVLPDIHLERTSVFLHNNLLSCSQCCNGRALDRVTKRKHRPNRQKLSKKCPKIVFSAPLDNFSDIFRTFFGHSRFLGCPTICPLQSQWR